MLLPLRFGPSSDEVLLSYLLRLSSENGYHDPRWLIAKAGLSTSLATRPCNLNPLATLVGGLTTTDELARLSAWPVGNGLAGRVQFGKHHVSGHSLDMVHPKICVPCLEEGRNIPRVWNLRAYLACPLHGCLLTDVCSCGRSLSWFRPAPSQCSCKVPLSYSNGPTDFESGCMGTGGRDMRHWQRRSDLC
jgi:hypothetical protein